MFIIIILNFILIVSKLGLFLTVACESSRFLLYNVNEFVGYMLF